MLRGLPGPARKAGGPLQKNQPWNSPHGAGTEVFKLGPQEASVSGGTLDEELQLAYGRTTDVEHGPAGGQQDRGCDQDEPEVHGCGKGRIG